MKKHKRKLLVCILIFTLGFCNILFLKDSEAISVGKVSSLSMYSNSSSSISLKWKKVSYASGYKVYRATSKSGKYSTITTIKNGSTTKYTNSKLASSKTYYYKIRAYRVVKKKTYYGSYSNVLKAYTKISTSKAALKAYKKFLINTSSVKPEKYHNRAKTEKFALVDINKDGIKELLITDKTAYNYNVEDNGYQYAYVYTYKSGKVKYCGYAQGSSFTSLYIDSKGRLAYNWGGAGSSQYMYYNLNSSKSKLTITTFTAHYNQKTTYDKQTCDYNYTNFSKLTKISKTTFNTEVNIAKKGKLLKVYSNNTTNRDKYLK